MERRHLFDNGYPVCRATLVVGAEVLLGISRQSLRCSRRRLSSSLVGLADSADRVIGSLARMGASEIDLCRSRERYSTLFAHGYTNRDPARREENAHVEPRDRPACAEPHPR